MTLFTKTISLFIFLIFSPSLFCQTFDWAIGSEMEANTETVKVDPDGNFYKTGEYNGSRDLDPGVDELVIPLESGASKGAYLLKIDAEGELVWAKVFSGLESEGYAVELDNHGNVYVFIKYRLGDFDANPNSGEELLPYSEEGKCVLIKLNADGEFIWEKHFDGEVFATPKTLSINKIGHVLLTGSIGDGELDANPDPDEEFLLPAGTHSGSRFIIKLDTHGVFMWAHYLKAVNEPEDPPTPPRIIDAELDATGAVFIVGYYSDKTDFDLSADSEFLLTPPTSSTTNYILKLNPTGDFLWVKDIYPTDGSSGILSIQGIAIDDFGGVYTAGYFSAETDFNFGIGEEIIAPLEIDAFVLKTNGTTGDFQWVKTISGSEDEKVFDISIDLSSSQVLITGSSNSTSLDFDPSGGIDIIGTHGQQDIFVETLNFDGEYNWARVIGGSENDFGLYIGTDRFESIYVNGKYADLVDFDFGMDETILNASELGDLFFTKLAYTCDEESVYSEVTIIKCEPFTVPSGDETYFESGVYMDTIHTYFGCADSIITYDVTIEESLEVSIIQTDYVLSADLDGLTYQWIDCNADYSEIDGATEQDYTILEDGAYAVVVSNGVCSDTSDCIEYLFFSIKKNDRTKIAVYPNPTKGQLTIFLDHINTATIVNIRTVNGQLVYSNTFENEQSISVDFVGANGLYILEIKMEDEAVYFTKFLKE